MSGWKIAALATGAVMALWLVLMVVAVVTAVKGGKLIEEAQEQCQD